MSGAVILAIVIGVAFLLVLGWVIWAGIQMDRSIDDSFQETVKKILAEYHWRSAQEEINDHVRRDVRTKEFTQPVDKNPS